MWFRAIKILNQSVLPQINIEAHVAIFQNMGHCVH